MGEKWKLKFVLFEKMDKIQESFSDVGKRLFKGERDRISFSALNQLLCGHSILGAHMTKINPTVLNLNLNSLLVTRQMTLFHQGVRMREKLVP